MKNTKALLDPTPPIGEEDRVSQVFSMAKEMIGFIPSGLRLYGISPPLLETFAGTVGYFRNGTKLSPRLTTMIRYLVSERAGCQFCIDLNETILLSQGIDLDEIRAVRSTPEKAPLEDERERPLLALALAAVEDPNSDKSEMVKTARDAGWADREIFDAVLQATSNRAFNFALKTFNVETQEAFA
jgi:alkylhydroperoxidase family enzyme